MYCGTKIDVHDTNSYLFMLTCFMLVTIKWHVLQAYCQWNSLTYRLCRRYIYWKLCVNLVAETTFCFPRSLLALPSLHCRFHNNFYASPESFSLDYHEIKLHKPTVLFSWRYNPSWLYFHRPSTGFSLLVFEVS